MESITLNNLIKGLKAAPVGEEFKVSKIDISDTALRRFLTKFDVTITVTDLYYLITKVK